MPEHLIADVFSRLWSAEASRLERYCRRLAQGSDAEADEIFSATALRAWRGFGSLRDHSRFGAWLAHIARREGEHISRRRRILLLREVAFLDTHAANGDDRADPPSKRPIEFLIADAHAHGHLSDAERSVMRACVNWPADDGWERASSACGLPRDACAVHWLRGLPKLRVYMLLARPETVGGRDAIRAAYERAKAAALNALSPLEAETFRHEIVERRPPLRRDGWRDALRGACAKVIRHLDWDL